MSTVLGGVLSAYPVILTSLPKAGLEGLVSQRSFEARHRVPKTRVNALMARTSG
ncbi:MAG TPA: hypothetical protein VGV41_01960 [Pseudolabrys sp.]|nr:hypothetical protein [Pseudolabrys sp.]